MKVAETKLFLTDDLNKKRERNHRLLIATQRFSEGMDYAKGFIKNENELRATLNAINKEFGEAHEEFLTALKALGEFNEAHTTS